MSMVSVGKRSHIRRDGTPAARMSRETAARRPSISLVVPAFNEEHRISPTLECIEQYAVDWARRHREGGPWEVLVADDGSADRTPECVKRYAARWAPEAGTLHLLRLPHRGKGYAVREGMLAARGRYLVLTDADLSAPIEDTELLLRALQSGADVAIGSRSPALGGERLDEPYSRLFSSRIFNSMAQLIAVPGIADTQCGFKAFRHEIARQLFSRQRIMGLAFDVELLYLSRTLGYQIAEVPIRWRYKPGSRIHTGAAGFRMAGDLLRLRLLDVLGAYDMPSNALAKLPQADDYSAALEGGWVS